MVCCAVGSVEECAAWCTTDRKWMSRSEGDLKMSGRTCEEVEVRCEEVELWMECEIPLMKTKYPRLLRTYTKHLHVLCLSMFF